MLVPWSQTSQSPEEWEINVCCLSYPVCGICYSSLSCLRHCIVEKTLEEGKGKWGEAEETWWQLGLKNWQPGRRSAGGLGNMLRGKPMGSSDVLDKRETENDHRAHGKIWNWGQSQVINTQSQLCPRQPYTSPIKSSFFDIWYFNFSWNCLYLIQEAAMKPAIFFLWRYRQHDKENF